LGDVYNSMKEYERSDQAYEEALRLKPDNDVVLNNYSYFLALRKATWKRPNGCRPSWSGTIPTMPYTSTPMPGSFMRGKSTRKPARLWNAPLPPGMQTQRILNIMAIFCLS